MQLKVSLTSLQFAITAQNVQAMVTCGTGTGSEENEVVNLRYSV